MENVVHAAVMPSEVEAVPRRWRSYKKRWPSDFLTTLGRMDPLARIALNDFLKGGRLPRLRQVSDLVNAGVLIRENGEYVAAPGVREAVREWVLQQREAEG